jgi:two-component system, chemotaxis family, protein-glutamate methylesterase/glutaminase
MHVSPLSPSMLPLILNANGGIKAAAAKDGERIEPSRVYVASPDLHMLIEPGRVRLTRGPKENRHRPSIDPLFRTAARAYGPRVIGIVLTGLLDDGAIGLHVIKHEGGISSCRLQKLPKRLSSWCMNRGRTQNPHGQRKLLSTFPMRKEKK